VNILRRCLYDPYTHQQQEEEQEQLQQPKLQRQRSLERQSKVMAANAASFPVVQFPSECDSVSVAMPALAKLLVGEAANTKNTAGIGKSSVCVCGGR
jgi:hypothetical protein